MFNKNFSVFCKKYGFKSIAVKNSLKLFSVFLIILIIPICIIYNLTLHNSRHNILKTSGDNVKKIGATVETLIRDTEYLAVEMLADKDISYYLSASQTNDYNISNITNKIEAYKSGKNIIQSVYLYNDKSNYVCSDKECVPLSDFTDKSWYIYYTKKMPENYCIYSRNIDNSAYNVLTLIKKKINGNGCIVLNIDLNAVERYIREYYSDDNGFYIVSKDGVLYTNLLTSKRDSNIEDGLINMIDSNIKEQIMSCGKDKVFVATEKSDYYEWHYVNTILNKNNVIKLRVNFILGVLAFLIILFVLIVVAVIMSMNNVSQIVNLLDLFENREIYNNLSVNEISAISDKILLLMDDNEKLKKEVRSRSEEYEKWKIKALQTQITPHFLNNTLAVINLKVIDTIEDNEDISRMISKLSSILDYTLITDKIFVTLREELEFIRNYIYLLKLRYSNLNVNINVPEEYMSFYVLRMSLQPIIENAVFYNGKDKADVSIDCEKRDDSIMLCITDNGSGMDANKIEQIKKSFINDSTDDTSIGMKNVYKRLQAAFGNKADLDIVSEEGAYSKIYLKIPIDENELKNNE